VTTHLGSAEFTRIRTGVGRPIQDREVSDFVLEGFQDGESKTRDDVVERASKAIECLLQEGLTAAMNRYNPWGGRKAEGEAGEREETRD
jgi:PTH1 family peptidyl-tRNA hydrolase